MRAPDSASFDYLREAVATRVADRVRDIARTFEYGADIGCTTGCLGRALGDAGGLQTLLQVDPCMEMMARDDNDGRVKQPSIRSVQMDEEALDLEPESLDIAMSSLSLHWVNDLPGTLTSIRKALKPDGVFIAALFGEKTLQELRSSFVVADQEREGGISPHVSPFTRMRDLGGLLQEAGFALPTVDSDTIVCRYPDMFTLMHHLQGMSESNAVLLRRERVPPDVFLAAASAYESLYAHEDGLLPATFQVLYMIGWSPDAKQPRPLERGSARSKLKDVLKKQ